MTQIDELVMRIPGISEAEAGRLGKEVAQKIADALPQYAKNLEVRELSIKLEKSDLKNHHLLATVISEQVIYKIKNTVLGLK